MPHGDARQHERLPLRSPRTRLRRFPSRGAFDRETIYSILDEGLVCHAAFVDDSGQPYVLPTAYARIGDDLYLHGSTAGRAMRALGSGQPACVTVTLVDGIVLARTAFNHSFNYRSVVVLGTPAPVTDPEEKARGLETLVDRIVPGRSADVRPPTGQELKATSLLVMPIQEASAKLRSGPPGDAGDDLLTDAWAGVIPLAVTRSSPVPDPRLAPGRPVPAYVDAWRRQMLS